jgi:hypothetical protein
VSLRLRARASLELRRREEEGLDPYRAFQERYKHDPAGFVQDCIRFPEGEEPTPYQLETLGELIRQRRASIRSPHGAGKTALASWVILWFALTRDGEDWKIPTTASAWRQLTKYLWPEVHKWARRIDWRKVGRLSFNQRELLGLSLKLVTGEAFALTSSDPNAIEGAHAKHLLYVFDEAKAIPDGIWDSAEGAFASPETGEAMALAISTPGEPQGRFYDIHRRAEGLENWWARHVTLEEALAAGRIGHEWAENARRLWGESSPIYKARVLGEFAEIGEQGIIPLAWVEAAIERWKEWRDSGFPGTFTGMGVDVGGGGEGSDQTIFALAYDHVKVKELEKHPRADPMTATMEVAGKVAGVLRREGRGTAVVDAIGLGAGVYNRLVEMKWPAVPFVASRGTGYLDASGTLGFANWRAAAWWITREILDPQSGIDVMLPDDDKLIGDLTAPRLKRVSSASKMIVEDKEQVRKRLGRSTDCGDAVVQILVGPHLWREQEQGVEFVHRPVQIGAEW